MLDSVFLYNNTSSSSKLTTNNRAKARSLGSSCVYLTSASNRLEANADESVVPSLPDASAATAKYLAVGMIVLFLDASRFLEECLAAVANLSFLFAVDELNRQLLLGEYGF